MLQSWASHWVMSFALYYIGLKYMKFDIVVLLGTLLVSSIDNMISFDHIMELLAAIRLNIPFLVTLVPVELHCIRKHCWWWKLIWEQLFTLISSIQELKPKVQICTSKLCTIPILCIYMSHKVMTYFVNYIFWYLSVQTENLTVFFLASVWHCFGL